ncbi:hypothetical protein SAMN05216288_0642 [Pseudomonas punonensis]|uniref:Uncharacterized protein n=1 Tax=Phytopseudomonas punonensis TaxID=1220495 RepID=A0A1M7P4T1_9GAMM|nr:hypothetical protein SAMN05216288_0642 [Pseudomonas punonensis]
MSSSQNCWSMLAGLERAAHGGGTYVDPEVLRQMQLTVQ